MPTVSAAFQAHLDLPATQIATCWKCTRTDGQVFGFTDHDADLIPSGSPSVTYSAATGYTRSAIQSNASLAVDNMDLDGMLDSDDITLEDLRAGLWDFCEVEVFLVVWSDLSISPVVLGYGRLGEVRSNGRSFSAELLGLRQQLQQDVGGSYAPGCDANLFDARCGLVEATYTVTGTLTSVVNRRQFTDSGRAEVSGYFDFGKMRFTTGANAGLSMEVKTFASGQFVLQLPMPFAVTAGDQYSLIPGCPKTPEACKTKFLTNNIVNFRGFPFLPGTDRITSGGM